MPAAPSWRSTAGSVLISHALRKRRGSFPRRFILLYYIRSKSIHSVIWDGCPLRVISGRCQNRPALPLSTPKQTSDLAMSVMRP